MPFGSRVRRWVLPVVLGLAVGCGGGGEDEPGAPLMVFAAASLREAATEIGREFEARWPQEIVLFNFAGSNTLAQQIVAAPGADLLISADENWVDFAEDEGRAVPGSRRRIFGNRLVLVGRPDAGLGIAGPEELARARFRHLALADPAAVPAGRYARAYLEGRRFGGLTLWERLADRIVPALDVRAALALAESDPSILAIVYRTDAVTSSRVRVLYEIPPADHPPIVYWAVAIAGGARPDLATAFLEFLAGPEAGTIASRHGFTAGPS